MISNKETPLSTSASCETTPSTPDSPPKPSRWHRWRSWRVSVATGALLSFTVLVLNCALLGWSLNRPHHDVVSERGMVNVFRGDCGRAANVFKWSHLAINIMSTLLMSASTVGIQCASAPTRTEIDTAHAAGAWMHVGVVGWRNWRWISGWRRAVWVALLASSLPLHLFYNSVVFFEYASNDYSVHYVSANFVNETANDPGVRRMQESVPGRARLDPDACLDALSVEYVDSYRDMIVVLDYVNATQFIVRNYNIGGQMEANSISWICESDSSGVSCEVTPPPSAAEYWRVRIDNPFDDPTASGRFARVSYCLAEETEAQCTVVVARHLLAVVVLCNTVKVVCLACITLRGRRGFAPLITVGDAVTSFLIVEDATTSGEGALFSNKVQEWSRRRSDSSYWMLPPNRAWSSKWHFWFRGASPWNWAICILLCVVTLSTSFSFLITEPAEGKGANYSHWKSLGFGVSPSTAKGRLVTSATGKSILENVLLVNTPQLIISILYVLYNGLLTSALLSSEYSAFASRRRGLRVSERHGAQRSTYWLSLPYRYALPLIATMGILHWLVSQSIFLLRIRVVKGDKLRETISGCGWSPLALFWACFVGLLLTVTLLCLGFKTLGGGIPVTSSNSVALSAASHRREGEDEGVALQRLMYGVIGDNPDGTKRVGFSALEVMPLIQGEIYK